MLTVSAFYIKVPFGNWLFEKGLEAKKEWRLKEAVSYFKWSARLGVKTDLANFEEAYCHQLQGEYFRSQAQLEKLLANSIISQELKGRILNVNGRNLFNQNKSDKALESHEESLKIARLINNRKLEAESLVGLSRVLYHTKGKFDEARNNLDRALAIGKEINDELIIADALRNIGVVLWWGNGELDRPLEQFYKPALALYRKNGDLRSEATMLSNISFIYSFKGDGFQHIKLQNQALAIREKIGDRAGLSESYRAQGSAYLSVRNFKKAREFLVRSADIAKKIGFSLAQNEAETYLAGVLVELGEYDEAIRLFEQLLKRDKDSPVLAKSRLGSIANCHFLKGDYLKAREVFEQILEIELKSDLKDIRSISALYVYLGNTYLHLDKLDRAKEH
ncbi:MAG: tetratricopeptide repeat protein, partial [Pyrinomonadaceae bacterium]